MLWSTGSDARNGPASFSTQAGSSVTVTWMAIRRAYRSCLSTSPLVAMTTEETSGSFQSRFGFRAWAGPGAGWPSWIFGPKPSSCTPGGSNRAAVFWRPAAEVCGLSGGLFRTAGCRAWDRVEGRTLRLPVGVSPLRRNSGRRALPGGLTANLTNPQDELRDLGIGVRKPLPEFGNFAISVFHIRAELLFQPRHADVHGSR